MFQVIKLKEIHIFEKYVGGCMSLKGDAELSEKIFSKRTKLVTMKNTHNFMNKMIINHDKYLHKYAYLELKIDNN